MQVCAVGHCPAKLNPIVEYGAKSACRTPFPPISMLRPGMGTLENLTPAYHMTTLISGVWGGGLQAVTTE